MACPRSLLSGCVHNGLLSFVAEEYFTARAKLHVSASSAIEGQLLPQFLTKSKEQRQKERLSLLFRNGAVNWEGCCQARPHFLPCCCDFEAVFVHPRGLWCPNAPSSRGRAWNPQPWLWRGLSAWETPLEFSPLHSGIFIFGMYCCQLDFT